MKPVSDYHEILNELESHFSDPGSEKSGEYLKDHIISSINPYLDNNRTHIVRILSEWINQQKDPYTILAVTIVGELKIHECLADLHVLRENIINNLTNFPKFYAGMIERVIKLFNCV